MHTLKLLKDRRNKTDAELQSLAEQLNIPLDTADRKLLAAGKDKPAGSNPAREQLLLKLDAYEALTRSQISQTLSFISVILSIISALVSIYASLKS